MKSLFEQQTINEFTARIENISADSKGSWGKMSVCQMLKHCIDNDKMLQREKTFKRLFIGRIIGKFVLKGLVKNSNPLEQNSPTHPNLVFKEGGNVEQLKKDWIAVVKNYSKVNASIYKDFVHPFFGKMNTQQVNDFGFKHIDHHLRQFGV